jgi:hypothetical protein
VRLVPDAVVLATMLTGRPGPPTCFQFVMVPSHMPRGCAVVRLKTRVPLFTTTANRITATGWPDSAG